MHWQRCQWLLSLDLSWRTEKCTNKTGDESPSLLRTSRLSLRKLKALKYLIPRLQMSRNNNNNSTDLIPFHGVPFLQSNRNGRTSANRIWLHFSWMTVVLFIAQVWLAVTTNNHHPPCSQYDVLECEWIWTAIGDTHRPIEWLRFAHPRLHRQLQHTQSSEKCSQQWTYCTEENFTVNHLFPG